MTDYSIALSVEVTTHLVQGTALNPELNYFRNCLITQLWHRLTHCGIRLNKGFGHIFTQMFFGGLDGGGGSNINKFDFFFFGFAHKSFGETLWTSEVKREKCVSVSVIFGIKKMQN